MINGHGDDLYLYEQKITANFSSNAFYGADLHGLKQHLSEHMEVIASYPEPEPYTLEALLAQKYGLQKEEVCVTNGATEAIYLVAQAFAGCRSGIVMPTFSEYADACCMHQHRVTSLYSLQALPNSLEMLWLCNPNNPTGKVFDKAELIGLISKHSDICFVIDQSYEDFTLKPLLSASEAAEFPNVILLHSLTKRFSIPGLRLGYVTASSALLQRIRMKRMPWSVNALAIEAGKYLLNKTITS
jgi:threonine-phosphate decarboxylase